MLVEHDRDAHRFYIQVPAGTAELSYQQMGEGILDLFSTYVPPAAMPATMRSALCGKSCAQAP